MIWEDILTEFAKYDEIQFAYQTVRVVDQGSTQHPANGPE
jgi:hypothetical protein